MNDHKFILSNYIKPNLIKVNGSLCNASFFYKNEKLMLIGRKTNYSPINDYMFWPQWFYENWYSDEVIYEMNNDNAIFYKILSSPSNEEKAKYCISGNEDIRLMYWNNELFASYSKANITKEEISSGNVNTKIHICKIDNDLNLVDDKTIITPQPVEKNWQPIEDKKFEYIYSYNPFIVIDLNNIKKKKLDNKFDKNYFGSSQVIKYKDNYITIVHYKENNSYYHYFVLFDKDLKLKKISNTFKFFGANIEFCTYIGIIENKLTILASVNDQLTYRFNLSDDIINNILNDKLDDSSIKETLYEDFYNDSIINSNYLSAITLSTFIKNKDILIQALKLTQQYNSVPNSKFFLQNKIIENL